MSGGVRKGLLGLGLVALFACYAAMFVAGSARVREAKDHAEKKVQKLQQLVREHGLAEEKDYYLLLLGLERYYADNAKYPYTLWSINWHKPGTPKRKSLMRNVVNKLVPEYLEKWPRFTPAEKQEDMILHYTSDRRTFRLVIQYPVHIPMTNEDVEKLLETEEVVQ